MLQRSRWTNTFRAPLSWLLTLAMLTLGMGCEGESSPEGTLPEHQTTRLSLESATTSTFALSPTGWAADRVGGNIAVQLTAPSRTSSWTATSSASWLTVSPRSGRGSASLTVTASVYTGSSATRTAAISVGGQTFQVTQYGEGATLALSANSWHAPLLGGSTTVDVSTAPSTLGWTATSSAAWLTVSPTSGTGNGVLTLAATSNNLSLEPRSATVNVGGRTITVSQDGDTPTGGNTVQNVTPSTWAPSSASQTTTVKIKITGGGGPTLSLSGCTSDVSWARVTALTKPKDYDATVEVDANTGNTRTGTITFTDSTNSSKTLTITQASPPATVTLSPTSLSFVGAGETKSTAISAVPAGGSWTVSNSASWLTFSATSGSGGATLNVTAAASTSVNQRTASVIINNATLSVTQSGQTATYSLDASTWAPAVSGGTTTVALSSNVTDGAWTASSSNTGWLTVSPTSGSGPASLTLTATSNAASALTRTATVTIAGQTVTVTQAGTTPTFTVNPTSWSFAEGGGTKSVTVTVSPSDGTWSASSDQSWLTVSPSTGGDGDTFTMTAEAHTASVSTRSATVTIGNASVSVTQAGATPTFTLSPPSWSPPGTGGFVDVTVTPSPLDATWSVTSSDDSWLFIGSTSGSGTGTVRVTATSNTGTVAGRSGSVTFGSATFNVNQDGATPTYVVSPTSWTFTSAGGTKDISLAVTPSDATWTATSSETWLGVSPASGSNSGTVTLTADAYTTSVASRTATVTIAGQTINITQTGPTPTVSLTTSDNNVPEGGGTRNVNLNISPDDASWTATSSQSWLQLSATSGTGDATLTATFAAHTTSVSPRTATVTSGGTVLTFTQDGATPTYALSPTTWTVPEGGDFVDVTVTATPSDATWTVTSSQTWLTTSAASGSGNGTVRLTAAAHTTSVNSRSATVTIGGQTVSVTQAGATPVYSVTPASWTVVQGGGSETLTITVTPSDAPAWTAVANDGWLSVDRAGDTGNGTLTISAADHTGTVDMRFGTLTVAGNTINVSQAGEAPLYILSASGDTIGEAGGTLTVDLTTSPVDAPGWTASSAVGWLTVSPASGTGDETFTITVDPHTDSVSPRTGIVTIAGETFEVTQDGATPTYGVTPTTWALGSAGGTESFAITATPSDAPWTVDNLPAWLTANFENGTGTMTIALTADAHLGTVVERNATVTIAGIAVGVTQAGELPVYTLLQTDWLAPPEAGSNTFDLDATPGDAPWTATANDTWLRVTPTSGQGPATFTVEVDSNEHTTISRVGTITVGGETYTVTQEGVPPVFTVTPAEVSASYYPHMRYVELTVDPADGAWTATSSEAWVTVSPASGVGPQRLTLDFTGHTTSVVPRTATITVGSVQLQVTQSGPTPTYTVSPGTWAASPTGATTGITVDVSPEDAFWEIRNKITWLQFDVIAGSGDQIVQLTAVANPSARTARSGSFTIAGKTVTATQAPSTATFTLAPTTVTALGQGSVHTVQVTPDFADARWTARSDQSWITLSPTSGTGSGSVRLTVAPSNLSGATRTATVTIGDAQVAVTQSPATGTTSVYPMRLAAPDQAGGTLSTRLYASHADLNWTASSNAAWLSVSPTSGTGSATLTVTVAAAPNAAERTGTLTVGGHTVEVVQNGALAHWSLVTPTTYMMGSPSGEAGRLTNETQRSVRITRGLYVQKTPVTQSQWQGVMGHNPSQFSGCTDCPVERVNWFDAITYANALSQAEGLNPCYTLASCSGSATGSTALSCGTVRFVGTRCSGYRLPTEAEWELSARAGSTDARYNANLGTIAWWSGNAGSATEDVGQLQANAWGLVDVFGNVAHWTHDRYGTYGTTTVTDPVGLSTGTGRVVRGCGYNATDLQCRAALRRSVLATSRQNAIGVRLVRTNVTEEISLTLSTIAATSNHFADGSDTSTVTIRILNLEAQPIPGTIPSFAVSGTGNTVGACSATNALGFATCALRSSVAESKRLYLMTPVAKAGPSITFRAPPSEDHSELRWQDQVMADGTAQAAIVIKLVDTASRPIANTVPTFDATGSGNTYHACTKSNAQGLSYCTMSSTVAEAKTLSVTFPVAISDGPITFRTPTSGDAPVWVLVSAGTYVQGSPTSESGRSSNEAQRSVTITRDFHAQTTPVTQKQWRDLMGNNPSRFATCGDDCPVEQINWFEAAQFANDLSQGNGLSTCYTLTGCSGVAGSITPLTCTGVTVDGPSCEGYRLPTEAEWEYLARADFKGARYEELSQAAWWSGNALSRTWRTGLKWENAWGFFDVLGNTMEWTSDWYVATYGAAATDPVGPASGTYRVARSCAYNSTLARCRLAARNIYSPRTRSSVIGLRLVRTDAAGAGGLNLLSASGLTPAAQAPGEAQTPERHSGSALASGPLPVTSPALQGPMVMDDAFAIAPTPEGQAPVAQRLDVLANDVDPRGQELLLSALIEEPTMGEVREEGQHLVYLPRAGATGVDRLTYEVCNEQGACAQARAELHVVSGIPAPVARDDHFASAFGERVVLDVLANDFGAGHGSELRVHPLAEGVLEVESGADGAQTLAFAPAPGFVGQVRFPYTLCVAEGPCHTAQVTVEVSAANPDGLSGEDTQDLDAQGCATRTGGANGALAPLGLLAAAALLARRRNRRPRA